MSVFPRLVSPETYRACDTDLLTNEPARAYWLGLFASHFDVQLKAARDAGISEDAIAAARDAWRDEMRAFHDDHARFGRLDILLLDERRSDVLISNGVTDEFRVIKARENERALSMLPVWIERLEREQGDSFWSTLMCGMLAGNLFDMGVTSTADVFAGGPLAFEDMLERVPPRPWFVDGLASLDAMMARTSPRRTVILADNAGADVVLGVLPLAWAMLRQDPASEVVIAANETPSLNDITIDELRSLREAASAVVPALQDSRLSLVSSGTGAPLIDLSAIGLELAEASENADFVVLVGMGRSIESNWSARFSCPSLRVALLKDPQVAATIGGRLFDAVIRFEGADGTTGDPG
ncbi:MAG: ARMT1-like domain-containing protein [Planctomycetota bacterium]